MQMYYNRDGSPADSYDKGDYRIAESTVGAYWVSTVFMPINHQFGEGPPLIFETMVFKGEDSDLYCDRYSTEEQALAGHNKVVAHILKHDAPPPYGEDL